MVLNKLIFNEIVNDFMSTKDKNGESLKMDYLTIIQDDVSFTHVFNNAQEKVDLRSLCKPIIALTLGMAIDQGLSLMGEKLTLDTHVFPFIENLATLRNKTNLKMWQKVTLRHVLTHSIGFAEGLLFSKDIKDKDPSTFLDFIINHDIIYEPGTHFVYSNVGPYLLSVIIQEHLGINLSEWIASTLFSKLDITDYEWKNYGKYCAGATGLFLKHEDFNKIGMLLLNKGKYYGQTIVPTKWVESMCTIQLLTPTMYDEKRVFPKYGYGFFVYICKNGNYYIDGTNGQYIIVIPKNRILVTTMGHQPDMKPITECLRILTIE